MPDNITAPATGVVLATDEVGGVQYPRSKVGFGADGAYTDVSADAPLPVALVGGAADAGLTNEELRAAPVPVALADPIAVEGDFYPAIQSVTADTLPLPNGAATAAKQDAMAAIGTETYTLASNITLAAGASGPTVTVPRGGYFFFDAVFTGSSPSLKLQRLGADGATWLDVVTRTTAGTGDPVGIPNGSQLRVTNAGSGSLAAVSAVLG